MTSPVEHTSAVLRTELENGSLAGIWILDSRSTARFQMRHLWGLVAVRGHFRVFTGEGTVSPTGELTGRVTLATRSVDTKNATRDKHLQGSDFFHTERHPEIQFELDALTPASSGATMSGTLTIRGISRHITFPATISLNGDTEAVLDATVKVNRADYGITVNHLGIAKMIATVTLHAVFTRK